MSPRDEPNRKAVYAATLATYLGVAGVSVVSPILPAIGAAVGATAWQVETLITAYVALIAIGTVPALMAAGRFGSKPVLITGVVVVSLSAILASLSRNIIQLAALRGLWGLGNAAFFATALVLIVALARNRTWAIGMFEAAIGLGFATGPLIGGLLGQVSWRLPLFACGAFMLVALAIAAKGLTEPAQRPAKVRVVDFGRTYRRPAFLALAAVTASYNFIFFIVLGYTALFLHLGVVVLGLAFSGWGAGLAFAILVLGQRLVRRVGAVATAGISLAGLAVCLVLFATSTGSVLPIVVLVWCGVFTGLGNTSLTDLALGLGPAERRVSTGAFNVVRLGASTPAPVLSGLLAEHVSRSAPYWVGLGVLVVGLLIFLASSHRMAAGMGERSPWSRWGRSERGVSATPDEALGDVI